MNIETKGKKDEGISRPAGINDVTSIVSIAFTVNNRDKEMDIDKKAKKKTKTILLNNIIYNDIYTGSVKEVQSKTYSLKNMSCNKTILELGMYDSEETITINDFLKQIYMENTEIIDKEDEMIKFDELKDLRLEIRYKNKQEEFKTLKAPLKLENDFASNKLFYN